MRDTSAWVTRRPARLAHAGFAHNGYNLAVTCGGPFQGLPERFKLVLPAYKAGQAARGHGLKTAMDCTGPGEFEDLHREPT